MIKEQIENIFKDILGEIPTMTDDVWGLKDEPEKWEGWKVEGEYNGKYYGCRIPNDSTDRTAEFMANDVKNDYKQETNE